MNIKLIKRLVHDADLGSIALFPSTLKEIDILTPFDHNKSLYAKIKEDNRSLQQNEYYWKIVIPTAQYYLDILSHCPNPKIKDDTDNAHYTLKLIYCFEQRPDLIEKKTYYCPIKKRVRVRAVPFSAKISEMSQKKFNDYLSWIQKRVNLASGLLWEESIKGMENGI